MSNLNGQGRMITVRLFSLLLLVFFSISLIGCSENFAVNIGFSRGQGLSGLRVAARSNQREFNVSNVNLEFHFGWEHQPRNNPWSEEYTSVGYALYFVTGSFVYQNAFIDYQNIENAFFIRLIPLDEFREHSFSVFSSFWRGTRFNHFENLIIPREVIRDCTVAVRSIAFAILEILLNNNSYEYRSNMFDSIYLRYEFINEETIRFQ